jgi:molecular chaperone HtpG
MNKKTKKHKDEPEINRAKVDFEGLMQVLGNNLYSTPTVALRELVQNAHDSCIRRQLESGAFEPRIEICVKPELCSLIISDNGAGLTNTEIHDYLATVGAGYTKILREKSGQHSLIGAFGLGFLSAYIVAERVEVFTTSYQTPEQTWRFFSRDGQRYTIEPVSNEAIGTRVVLRLRSQYQILSDIKTVARILERYCCLLPLPIFAPHQVNALRPPWTVKGDALSPLRRKKLQLEFASRFEPHFEPITTISVTPDANTHTHGLLWIQDGATYGSSDNRRIVLFVRGMLITDDARELLPRWAGFVGGVIECDQLSPTASRESVQENETFRELAFLLQETLIDGLAQIAKREPQAWRRILLRHNEALLGAAICDQRLFTILHCELTVPTSEGDLQLSEILERADGKIYISANERGGYEEVLFRALSKPIVNGYRYATRPFCQLFCDNNDISLIELGTTDGNRDIFPPADISALTHRQFAEILADTDTELRFSRFSPDSLPIVLVTNREIELKRRIEDDEADRRISAGILGLARIYTQSITEGAISRIYINLNCPLVQHLTALTKPRQTQGLYMLKALAQLMASPNHTDTHRDLAQTLELFSATVLSMLDG